MVKINSDPYIEIFKNIRLYRDGSFGVRHMETNEDHNKHKNLLKLIYKFLKIFFRK